MVPIVKQMCPTSRYSIKCPYTRTPRNIVIHNTANDAPAANEISYMINRPEEISFHLAIDDKEIRQALPFDRNAWASGDGTGAGNMYGIHIEICYSLSGGDRFTKAERNTAEYVASLLKQYGWGIEKVTKHQDYDGKYCPHRTLDLGWQRFINMIKGYMKEEEEMTYADFKKFMTQYEKEQASKPVSGWAKEAVAYVQDKKIMVGDGQGNFKALSGLTRQEAAQIIYNILTSIDK